MASAEQPERSRTAIEGENFLPNFCAVRSLFVLVLLTELLAFILTLAAGAGERGFTTQLSLISLLLQWIALPSAAVLCLGRRWLQRLATPAAAAVSLAVPLAICLGVSELAYQLLHGRGLGFTGDGREHAMFLARGAGITVIAVALALRYLYIQHQWRINLISETEARIRALQARIQPHFLFNSMNTIASLIRVRPERAEEAVEDLSDLFRASLRDTRTYVELREELELCRLYERLEQLRLGERLAVDWRIDELPGELEVPRLCLQPLLENAIYHGIEGLRDGGTVTVRGGLRDGTVELEVANPLPAGGHAGTGSRGNRMALENIRQRLELAYGDRARLDQSAEETYYRVRLSFPERYHAGDTGDTAR